MLGDRLEGYEALEDCREVCRAEARANVYGLTEARGAIKDDGHKLVLVLHPKFRELALLNLRDERSQMRTICQRLASALQQRAQPVDLLNRNAFCHTALHCPVAVEQQVCVQGAMRLILVLFKVLGEVLLDL